MSNISAKSDLTAPSPSASFSADSANPSSLTNLEKDGTTEQSIKTNDASNESKKRDSPQNTDNKRSSSFYHSTSAFNQPSKLIKSDTTPNNNDEKKPAPVLTKKSVDTTGSIKWHSQSNIPTRTKIAQHIARFYKQNYPAASNEWQV